MISNEDDDVSYVPAAAPVMTNWELFVLCLCFLAVVVGGLIYGRRYSTNRGGVPRSSSSDPSSSLGVAQDVELESLHVADGRERGVMIARMVQGMTWGYRG